MTAHAKRPAGKHRGSLRTPRRVAYIVAAMAAAVADPDLGGQVALLGNLFPQRRGKAVTAEQLARALAACDPTTGLLLRARVNSGYRREGEHLVSNVCHGFDIPLATDKSLSVAALVFRDDVVLKTVLKAMRQSARWLSKRMDRRLRKGGQNATVQTGTSAVFFLPEKAGRNGQPHLHAHLVFPNLTIFREDGRKKHCAGHFKRITQHAMAAQRRMNRQIARNLKKSGYVVTLVDGVCRLPSVSEELCKQLSPVSGMLNATTGNNNPVRRRSTKQGIRRRENLYLNDRPKKELKPLAQWRAHWEQVIGAEKLKAQKLAYHEIRYEPPVESSENPIPFASDRLPAPAIAAHRMPSSLEDVLEDGVSEIPAFKSLGVALRSSVEREFGPEARGQVIELDYSCPERERHLVEHTEALRTLLRLIFPRLIVHQKFTATERSSFRVTGAAAASPNLAQLVTTVAAALEVELGQASVRANWPAVLRWLHSELANRAPEPVVVVRRERTAPRIKPTTPRAETPAHTNATHPAPPPPEPPLTPVVDWPEMDIMP